MYHKFTGILRYQSHNQFLTFPDFFYVEGHNTTLCLRPPARLGGTQHNPANNDSKPCESVRWHTFVILETLYIFSKKNYICTSPAASPGHLRFISPRQNWTHWRQTTIRRGLRGHHPLRVIAGSVGEFASSRHLEKLPNDFKPPTIWENCCVVYNHLGVCSQMILNHSSFGRHLGTAPKWF